MGVKRIGLVSLELSAPPDSSLDKPMTEKYAKVKVPQAISPVPGELSVVGVKRIPICFTGMMPRLYRLSVTVGMLMSMSGYKVPM